MVLKLNGCAKGGGVHIHDDVVLLNLHEEGGDGEGGFIYQVGDGDGRGDGDDDGGVTIGCPVHLWCQYHSNLCSFWPTFRPQ